MEYLNLLLQGLIGISAGVIIAGSFLAFLSMIGIIPRIAAVTKTMDHAVMFEDAIVLGAVLGNVIYLYSIQISLGWIGLVFYGFFGGFFVGCLAAALAEVLKSVPIFSRRLCSIPWRVFFKLCTRIFSISRFAPIFCSISSLRRPINL